MKFFILDTGFLSSLAKIDRLNLIKEEGFVIISFEAYKEIKNAGNYGYEFANKILNQIAFSESDLSAIKWILVAHPKGEELEWCERLLKKYPHLDIADVECIILGKRDPKYILLIDDRDAREVARKEGLECFDIPSFLEVCILRKKISKSELEEIFTLLKKKDFYEFNEDVKFFLLHLFEKEQ